MANVLISSLREITAREINDLNKNHVIISSYTDTSLKRLSLKSLKNMTLIKIKTEDLNAKKNNRS